MKWKVNLGILCLIIACYIRESYGAHCVTFGLCNTDSSGKQQTCVVNQPPVRMTNKTALNILNKICPHYFEEENPLLCCDSEHISVLETQYDSAAGVFKRCPSCLHNLGTQICGYACHPNQSDFQEVIESKISLTTQRSYTVAQNIYVTSRFMDSLFYSCSQVILPSLGERAMDTACGGYTGDDCTPERWFEYTGNPDPVTGNPYTPSKINFIRADHPYLDFKAYDPKTVNCYEAIDNESTACSCADCPKSCPITPEYPKSSNYFKILGVDGYITIGVAFFVVVVIIFYFTQLIRCKKTPDYEFDEVQDRWESSSDGSLARPNFVDKFHFWVEEKLRVAFTNWGYAVASHPTLVIALASWAVAILTYGIFSLDITTDPVQIWAAADSQSRIEKDYFESRFGPFYRSEQLFIKAIGLPKITHPTAKGTLEFGPAFNKDFLLEVLKIQQQIEAIPGLVDICYAPLAPTAKARNITECTVQSIWGYFQNNITFFNEVKQDGNYTVNYLDQIHSCTQNSVGSTCMAPYGGNVLPQIALGGFLDKGPKAYEQATGLVVTYVVTNYLDSDALKPAMEWETKFIDLMQKYIADEMPSWMDIAMRAERSIEDGIESESESEAVTIVISYLLMFAYISIALGTYQSWRTLLLGSKIGLGLGGIVVVLLSVSSALGIFGYIGTPSTLLVIEVIPFLVLAVGVDNMFILVTHHEKTRNEHKEVAVTIGETLGEIGPSLILTTVSEATCFALGGLSDMPAVKTFALYATVALVIDFILQMTVFTAFLALNSRRQNDHRLDLFCCLKIQNPPQREEYKSYLQMGMERLRPFMFNKHTRRVIIVVFLAWFCISFASIPHLEPGLDQSLSMPEDSYVYKSFLYMNDLLSVGPPVYFVLKAGLDLKNETVQNLICGGYKCDPFSLITQVYLATQQPEVTYISTQASSWLDDYSDWSTVNGCCKIYPNGTFCPHTASNDECSACPVTFTPDKARPDEKSFQTYLSFFLKDNPDDSCAKAGHAAYYGGVDYTLDNVGYAQIQDTYFMSYHTTLKTSQDYYEALRMARYVASNVTSVIRSKVPGTNVEVFPYSVFYVFYEQYLNIWHTSFVTLGMSVAAVFIVSLICTTVDILSSLIILCIVIMIVTDLAGLMVWWGINLNAITLVNLVMAVGISVEFCSHIVYAFNVSAKPNRLEKAQDAFINMGSSVLSGITLTKFLGIVVLAFSKTQVFRVFYFRMYLGIVLFGAAHGLIFLPVFLTYVGAERQGLNKLRKEMRGRTQ